MIDKITTHTPHAGAQGSTMTTKYINIQDEQFDSSWFVTEIPKHNINKVNPDSMTLMHPPKFII